MYYVLAGGYAHSPLLMGEVSKSNRNGLPNALGGSELGEFDSVKIVSMLGDA